jgi:hypothetical protein
MSLRKAPAIVQSDNTGLTFQALLADPNVKLKFLSDEGAYGFVFYALNTSTNSKICVVKIVLLDETNHSDDDSKPVIIRGVKGVKNLAPLSRVKEETDNSIILQRHGDGVNFYGSEILDKSTAISLIDIYLALHNSAEGDEYTYSNILRMIAFLNDPRVTHIGVFFLEPLVSQDISEDNLTFSIETAVNLLKLACAGKIASDLKPSNSVFATITELGEDKQEKLHNKIAQAIRLATTTREKMILEEIQRSKGTAVSIDAGILMDRPENFETLDKNFVNETIVKNNPSSKEGVRTKPKKVSIKDPIIDRFINDSNPIDISTIEKHQVATMLDLLFYDNPGTFYWLGSIIGDMENPRDINKIGAIWCLLKGSMPIMAQPDKSATKKRGGKATKYKIKKNKRTYKLRENRLFRHSISKKQNYIRSKK